MKQVLRKGLKHIVVAEVPDPVVRAHHVLVRPSFSLISSGTETASIHTQGLLQEVADNPSHIRKIWDVMKVNGPLRTLDEVRAKFNEYAVLGYSGAGVVVGKHSTVTDLEIGARVAYGGEGTGHGELIVTGRNLVAPIRDAVSFEHAAFATLGSIAMNAVRIASLGLGDTVAVIGLGLVGQLTAQLARLQGASVIAVDLRAERVALARELGVDHGLGGGDGQSLRDGVGAITGGRGVDCVIVAAAAKSAAPCEQALQICRDRGRIVVVGAVDVHLPWLEMYLKEIQLFMARAYGPGSYDPSYEQQGRDYPLPYVRWTENRNMEEFLRLLELGRVKLEPLITHRFALEDASAAYDTILTPESRSLAVLLRYPAPSTPADPAAYREQHKVELLQRSNVSAKSTIGVALIGAGNIARWEHLPSLKRIDGVTLRAVYSASGARGLTYARRFGAAYCTSAYEDILADPEIDAVVIASRNPDHAPQSLGALRAGKHVFVEKPMALTEAECRALCEAERQSGRNLVVGFNRRFAPDYLGMKRQLAGRSGLAVLNCRVNSPGISGSYWMADPAIGGAILGEAVHFADLFYWLLDAEPIEVSAFSLPTGSAEPIGENNLAASVRFSDGSIASLTYCTVGSKTSGGERVEAFAPGVGVHAENFRRLAVRGRTTSDKSRFFADKGYATQMESFIASVRAARPAAVTARDGARATIVCLRLLESARTGRSLAVELESTLGA
ncbi:MAG: bi-domain-containing oxidoreductase [Gemmatimonadaceae bacterium]